MADSIPAVLCLLTRSGVSVQWRDGKAVFKAAAAPPADIVALVDARKAEVSAFLHPEAVQRRLDAEIDVLQAPCPPDVSDDRWTTAIEGLRSFIARGYGAEALGLGWPRNELFAVPPLWSRVDLTGAGLLVGDRLVVEVTATAIRIKSSSGSITSFYRKPEIDYRLAFEVHLKATRGNYPVGSEEPRLRSLEAAVNLFRANNRAATIDEAKVAVLAAIKQDTTKEPIP